MISPGLLQKLMSNKPRNGATKIVRPCELEWSRMPKGLLFEVMAIIAEHCRKKDCKAEDLCVSAHLAEDKLQMVKILDKVRKPVKGWGRIVAAWNIIWKGRI